MVFLLVFMLMIQEVLKRNEKLPSQSPDTAKVTGKICGDHIGGGIDVAVTKWLDVSFEITVKAWKFFNRDIEDDSILTRE